MLTSTISSIRSEFESQMDSLLKALLVKIEGLTMQWYANGAGHLRLFLEPFLYMYT